MTTVTPPPVSATSPGIDTRRAERRTLRFDALSEALAEAERLADAESAGTLRATGNWSLGQALGHLAAWIDFAYDGWPARPPWFVRLLAPLMKRGVLRGTPKPGFRLPGAPDGTYATAPLPAAEGLDRFRRAVARLEAAPPPGPNPAFGAMSHREWQLLHQRHAELHLGFFHPHAKP